MQGQGKEGAPPPPARPMGLLPPVLRPASGVPLEPALRSRLERQMGFDLGGVRLRADSAAASLAFHLRAHAFTVGQQVFFAAGRFQPQTRPGLALLAHELTHVRQQPGGLPLPWRQLTFAERQTLEQEARAQERAALAGATPPALRGNDGGPRFMGNSDGEPPGVAAAPRDGDGALPPLVLSYASRTTAVLPLRQEATAAPPEASAPTAGAPPVATLAAPASEAPDPEQLAQQVYEWIQRRLRIERERRGIQRWH